MLLHCSSSPSRFTLVNILALSLLGPAAAQTAALASGPPTVTSISPGSGSPGDAVVLDGLGLDAPADQYYAWVRTSESGFVLNNLATSVGGGLSATVGPVAKAAVGHVEIWRGHGHAVAPQTRLIDGRLISVVESRVFVAHHTSPVGPRFRALSPSSQTIHSHNLSPGLSIDSRPLYPLPSDSDAESLRVNVVIETGGRGGNGSGNGEDLTWSPNKPSKATSVEPGLSWALQTIIVLDAPFKDTDTASAPERLAAALAEMLTAQFGSLGLIAEAEGSNVLLDTVDGIVGGFATIAAGGG